MKSLTNYTEEKTSKLLDETGAFFAFSNKQLDEGKKDGITYCSMGHGLICPTDKAKDFLSEKGYDPQYGARPLNRAIQKYLEDPVAEEILKGDINEGEIILADHDGKSEELKLIPWEKASLFFAPLFHFSQRYNGQIH